jgi:hypothetical protein
MMGSVLVSREALHGGDWITIAHPGVNKNQREYPEASLQAMLAMKGRHVVSGGLYVHEETLDNLRGIVTDTRRGSGGSVQVKVKWFAGKAPATAAYLTPSGTGRLTDGKVTDYQPGCLCCVDDGIESAFQKATKTA